MLDGLYQSVIVFFIPYLLFRPAKAVTDSGLDISDRLRFGLYIAHPVIFAINGYILMNTYQWDWILLIVTAISNLFIFIYTGIYSLMDSSGFLYGAANEVYGEATFWAVFFMSIIMCLFPRLSIKALQKVYFPYDVDLIREQEMMGMFDYLKDGNKDKEQTDSKSAESSSSDDTRKPKHVAYGSVDEDLRPIYPPSTATRTTHQQHSQNGSDSTNFTVNRMSMDVPQVPDVHPAAGRPSIDRARPSYDRIRASMDRVRPSFEASDDFTSAARLSRIESSHSAIGRFKPRFRGLSLSKSANN